MNNRGGPALQGWPDPSTEDVLVSREPGPAPGTPAAGAPVPSPAQARTLARDLLADQGTTRLAHVLTAGRVVAGALR